MFVDFQKKLSAGLYQDSIGRKDARIPGVSMNHDMNVFPAKFCSGLSNQPSRLMKRRN